MLLCGADGGRAGAHNRAVCQQTMTDGPAAQRQRNGEFFPCCIQFGEQGPDPLPTKDEIIEKLTTEFDMDEKDLVVDRHFKEFVDTYEANCADRIGKAQPYVSVAFGPCGGGYTLLVSTPASVDGDISQCCDTKDHRLAAPFAIDKVKGSEFNFRPGLAPLGKTLVEIDMSFAGGACICAWIRNYVYLFEFKFSDQNLANALNALAAMNPIELRESHYDQPHVSRTDVKKRFQMQVMGTATSPYEIQISADMQLYQAIRRLATGLVSKKIVQIELKASYRSPANQKWFTEFQVGLSGVWSCSKPFKHRKSYSHL